MLVADIKERHDRLDILINNAGSFEPERSLTKDGWGQPLPLLHCTFSAHPLASGLAEG
jgi:NAD(P)-dependent dehydrogenase (short-subunit alcohol dehydrogenase family)